MRIVLLEVVQERIVDLVIVAVFFVCVDVFCYSKNCGIGEYWGSGYTRVPSIWVSGTSGDVAHGVVSCEILGTFRSFNRWCIVVVLFIWIVVVLFVGIRYFVGRGHDEGLQHSCLKCKW